MKVENIFSKDLIYELARPLDSSYVDNAYANITNIVRSSITEMCKHRPIVTGVDFELVNECLTFSESQTSSLDLFVVLHSPQLELSTTNLNKNFFKKLYRRFILALRQIKEEKAQKKVRRKKKKQQAVLQQTQSIKSPNFSQHNYSIPQFKNDILLELVKYVTEKSLIVVNSKHISLFCKEDYGLNSNLYFVFKSNNYYKLFDSNTCKFILVNFKDRLNNIKNKNDATNNNFSKMLRVFNGLFLNIMGNSLNQILIESILYNCPNELFQNADVYDMFIKIFNFIRLKSISNFKSITNDKDLLNEVLCKNKVNEFGKFLNIIQKTM